MRRNLRTMILASTLLLAVPASSLAAASPTKDLLGRQPHWTDWIESVRVFVVGVWDFYGGYVDPHGDDGEGGGG